MVTTIADHVPDDTSADLARPSHGTANGFGVALDACDRADSAPESARPSCCGTMEDLDYADIADIIGVPLGTVKTFLHRARLALAVSSQRRVGPRRAPGETGGQGAS